MPEPNGILQGCERAVAREPAPRDPSMDSRASRGTGVIMLSSRIVQRSAGLRFTDFLRGTAASETRNGGVPKAFIARSSMGAHLRGSPSLVGRGVANPVRSALGGSNPPPRAESRPTLRRAETQGLAARAIPLECRSSSTRRTWKRARSTKRKSGSAATGFTRSGPRRNERVRGGEAFSALRRSLGRKRRRRPPSGSIIRSLRTTGND